MTDIDLESYADDNAPSVVKNKVIGSLCDMLQWIVTGLTEASWAGVKYTLYYNLFYTFV